MDDEIALLRRHDDAATPRPRARAAARSALRAHIAAAQHTAGPDWFAGVRRRTAGRSPLRIAAAVVTAVLVAVVATVVLPSDSSRPAYAVTPPLLTSVDDPGMSGAPVLKRLAAVAEEQPPLAEGRYRYLRSASWYLHTTVYDEDSADSVIVPSITEQWIADDGSGVVTTASGEPVEAGPPGAEADRRAFEDLPAGEGDTTEYGPGERWVSGTAEIRDPAALAALMRDDKGRPDHVVAFTALQELLHAERVQPDLLAEVYRMLADYPQLRTFGMITDRAGREGVAIGFDSDYAGLPTRYMLIVDQKTGTPLGDEEIVTTDPGKLNVRVPAVIGYQVYLAGGSVASTQQRAPRIP